MAFFQDKHRSSGTGIPDADRSVTTCSGKAPAIGAESKTVDRLAVSFPKKVRDDPAGLRMQESERSIPPACCQELSVRAERNAVNGTLQERRPEPRCLMPASDLPKPDRVIMPARGDEVSVRTEGDAAHQVVVSPAFERGQRSSRIPMPQLYPAVPPAGCDESSIRTEGNARHRSPRPGCVKDIFSEYNAEGLDDEMRRKRHGRKKYGKGCTAGPYLFLPLSP